MGLLDFKFLILLGLAIVIYFLYKELELHRDRLTFCEEKIKELKHLTFNENNITPLPPLTPHPSYPLQQPLQYPLKQPLQHPLKQPIPPHPSPNPPPPPSYPSPLQYNKLTSIQNKTVKYLLHSASFIYHKKYIERISITKYYAY